MTNFVTKPIPAEKPTAQHVERPWGAFEQYASNQEVTVSLMTVQPGQRLSLQAHTGRAELWIALDDGAEVQIGEERLYPRAGDELWIPANTQHRLSARRPAGAGAGNRVWQLAAGRYHPLRRRLHPAGGRRIAALGHEPRLPQDQPTLDARHAAAAPAGQYDIYPAFLVGPGQIHLGFSALADRLATARQVVIDGYPGVLWENFRAQLQAELEQRGLRAAWRATAKAMRPVEQINALVAPYLGGDDPLFGRRFTGALRDFFDPERLRALGPDPAADVSIVYGCGAALAGWAGLLVYVDVPKNEIQFRFRAGSVTNLGLDRPLDPKAAYKRCYFVDWVAANAHKAALLPRVDVVVDGQRPDEPALMAGGDLRGALARMARNYFRVRPWFEPGPWGGQWIKATSPGWRRMCPTMPGRLS